MLTTEREPLTFLSITERRDASTSTISRTSLQVRCARRQPFPFRPSMQRDIAVYTCDGELIQLMDEKRVQRLIQCGRVARIVKNRAGRIKRATFIGCPASQAFHRCATTSARSIRSFSPWQMGTVVTGSAAWATILARTRPGSGRSAADLPAGGHGLHVEQRVVRRGSVKSGRRIFGT